ncbi:MAG: C25 family cysteine peptidase [Candidatus Fermentibacterota bacterium]
MTESGSQSVCLSLRSGDIASSSVVLDGRNFTRLTVQGAGRMSLWGLPRMPVYRAWIEVPVDAAVTVDVDPLRIEQVPAPAFPVEPAVPSAAKCSSSSDFAVSPAPEVYSKGNPFPQQWADVVEEGMMRGRRLVLLEVMPLRWTPGASHMDLLAEAEVRVGFRGGDMEETARLEDRYGASRYDRVLDRLAVNRPVDGGFDDGDSPPSSYLVVAHSDLVGAMEDFVQWKQQLGFDVTLVDLTETGSSAKEIQDYILGALQYWPDPPEFVLLVGDHDLLPGGAATRYSGVTDLYYVTLDDGGLFPDAFIGRFPARTADEAELMAGRVIQYEQDVAGTDGWIRNTCWIASVDSSGVTEGTHDYCIDAYLDPLDYTWDRIYPDTYDSDAGDAISSINGGVSMLTFSGHGSQTSWTDMQFGGEDFAQLTNGGMLPGVISHACLTGDYEVETAWCETWTRTPGRGGLWFWGAVSSTYWAEDDVQERAEYRWFMEDGVQWPGGFLLGGKVGVWEHWSGGGRSLYYMEAYNLMGDPSVDMWVWGEQGSSPDSKPMETDLALTVPNPVRGTATIHFRGPGTGELMVYDLTGRVVAELYSGDLGPGRSAAWHTAGMPQGVYLVGLTGAGGAVSAKTTVMDSE